MQVVHGVSYHGACMDGMTARCTGRNHSCLPAAAAPLAALLTQGGLPTRVVPDEELRELQWRKLVVPRAERSARRRSVPLRLDSPAQHSSQLRCTEAQAARAARRC